MPLRVPPLSIRAKILACGILGTLAFAFSSVTPLSIGLGVALVLLLIRVIREIGRTIAQLKRQTAALAEARDKAIESARKYRLLFDANPKPMWVFDLETLRFTAVNEAAVRHYGYSRDEFLAITVKDITSHEETARLEDPLTGIGGVAAPSEWLHQKKDGTVIEVEISSDLIELEGRKSRLVLAHDVTDRKRLEEQYRQAQKMEAVGQLAGGVAHDFNNIITVILAVSSMLTTDPATPAELIEEIEEIRKAAQRAAALTRQLLAFSRKQVLLPQILDLNEVIVGMEKMLQRLLGEGIEFRTTLADDLKPVRADRGQIEQVIMNLAVNARDAMETGGILLMQTADFYLDAASTPATDTAQPGSYVLVTVTDTGSGMSTETRAHIFEPFFTTKEAGRGTGLGLATVAGIVKQAGGYVTVYSEPDRGSTFRIFLPSSAQAVDVIEEVPITAPLRGTETVLVVEDEEAVRRLTARILREQGYDVLVARNGSDALDIATAAPVVHLLVTDVVMPGMTGTELSERLQSTRPNLKTLFVSGYTNGTIVLEPGIEFLAKPFTVDALGRKVRLILDGRAPAGGDGT